MVVDTLVHYIDRPSSVTISIINDTLDVDFDRNYFGLIFDVKLLEIYKCFPFSSDEFGTASVNIRDKGFNGI